MQRALSALNEREFKVGVGVGTAITVVVGLLFVFLGGSIDDRPAIIPSTSLWLGALLAVECLALMAAWGCIMLYRAALYRDSPRLRQAPLVGGLVAGAIVGVLLVVIFVLGQIESDDHRSRRRRRGDGS
jgi:hypothetical protein